MLQLVYLAPRGLRLVGVAAGRGAGTSLEVTRTTRNQWLVLGTIGALATVGLTVLLDTVTDSTVPLPDAVTTVLSLLATWGQARKKLESWWLWITADVIYVPLYAYKDLWLTAVLYVGFLALCVLGLRNWRASLRTGSGYTTTPRAAAGNPASSATGQVSGSEPSATS